MSNASAVLPVFCPADLAVLRQGLRQALRAGAQVAAAAAHMAGFAAVVWLLLAGPGFLADDPAPARPPHATHR